ncbi:hypothetical protein D4764_22G0003370 [Takifugu flavidus]|uniref:IQ motif and SEC7 domain-containing protein 3 n=1 Tax=Takifugu flavidus TaxID=433684 RepID=A0A5C6NFB5_9TELE|nr:hypothetical protein D4764_22G0003370 [Takifugu flavidus]
MESLLDNPMKAVLYLKELTTIVQNQQSLIQTQRQRIDELERKVEDLIGENRQLREPHHYVQQPAQHHHPHQHQHHQTHRSASPQAPAHLHHHPGSNKASAHLGQQAQQPPPPPPPQQPPQQQPHQHQTPTPPSSHHPQQLQLVPTSPQSPRGSKTSPESAEESKRSPCCKSLVPQTPTTLCRSVGLARKAENQTVLHQFCCPAPEAPEVETSTACLPRQVGSEKANSVSSGGECLFGPKNQQLYSGTCDKNQCPPRQQGVLTKSRSPDSRRHLSVHTLAAHFVLTFLLLAVSPCFHPLHLVIPATPIQPGLR